MLRLYKIEGDNYTEFDLLEDSIDIPISVSQTDPTNPTKYTVEYSKNVKLPLTPRNMLNLGMYTELDSVVGSSSFRPTVAIDVLVLNDSDIIFEGKMKLEKVNNYKGNRNMECTLYGKMNDFFNKMLNTTYWWDSVQEDESKINSNGMYVLPNILDKGYNICKETVLASWMTLPTGTTRYGFHTATMDIETANSYNPDTSKSHSIISWIPTEQGNLANFENDKVIIGGEGNICYGGPQGGQLVEIYGTEDETKYIPVEEDQKPLASVVVGEGFSERSWCQFRSYYEKPCVYVNKLWQQYQSLSEEITGMPLVLDEDWFNTDNTRYTDLVYTLPDLQQDKKEEAGGSSQNVVSFNAATIDCHEYAFGTNGGGNQILTLAGNSITNGHVIVGANKTGYCNFNINLGIYLRRHGSLGSGSKYALCDGDGTASCIDLQIAFRNINDSAEVNNYNFKIIDENNNSWTDAGVDTMIRMGTKSWKEDPQTLGFNLTGEVLVGQNNTSANKEYEMIVSVYCYNGNVDGGPGQALFQSRGRIQNINALCDSCNDNPIFTFTNVQTSISITEEYRSFYPLEMKNMFPANYSPFNILMQYTKLFNLVWDYNQLESKVTVMTREKWFSKYQYDILNWTDKVDTSREFSFKPLAWDKKHVTFNYNDFEMDWLKTYKDSYGLPYGSKKITTQYNFNNDTEKLMCTGDSDKINPSVQVSLSRFPVSALSSSTPSPVRYYETFAGNRKDGKSAGIWGQFFFRNGVQNWDTDSMKNYLYTDTNGSSAWRNVGIILTDDTRFQIRRKIFAVDMTVYASSSDRKLAVPVTTRPIVSVFDRTGKYSCQFSKPAMTFYDMKAPEMNVTIGSGRWRFTFPVDMTSTDAYTNRWSNIIEEQYSEQNKLITCYVKLNDVDFRHLSCNRFVQIGDVLYSIYKVNDFQLGRGGMTKVQLLQVWNLKKYLREYYVEPEPEPEPEPGPEPVDLTTPFFVENITDEDETLSIRKDGSNAPTLTIEYKTDNTDWAPFGTTSTTALTKTLAPGERIYLRCNTNSWAEEYGYFGNIITGVSKIGGNVMSLLYGNNFNNQTEFPDTTLQGIFVHLFFVNTNLVDASSLLLPATTLASRCYYGMFYSCTSLTTAPELPATTLANSCYSSMFTYCTSLTTAPELPATTLASRCYDAMFYGCTSLTTTPELPATTLANSCYFNMFHESTSLNEVTCYATSGINENSSTTNWLNHVSPTGTFYKKAGVTWPTGPSGIPEGWTVEEV